MTFRHRGGHKRIVSPDGREPTLATKPQPDSGGDRQVVRQPDPTAAPPAPGIVEAAWGWPPKRSRTSRASSGCGTRPQIQGRAVGGLWRDPTRIRSVAPVFAAASFANDTMSVARACFALAPATASRGAPVPMRWRIRSSAVGVLDAALPGQALQHLPGSPRPPHSPRCYAARCCAAPRGHARTGPRQPGTVRHPALKP